MPGEHKTGWKGAVRLPVADHGWLAGGPTARTYLRGNPRYVLAETTTVLKRVEQC